MLGKIFSALGKAGICIAFGCFWIFIGRKLGEKSRGLVPVQAKFEVKKVGKWHEVRKTRTYHGRQHNRLVHQAEVYFSYVYTFNGISYSGEARRNVDQAYQDDIVTGLEKTYAVYIDPEKPMKSEVLRPQTFAIRLFNIIGGIFIALSIFIFVSIMLS